MAATLHETLVVERTHEHIELVREQLRRELDAVRNQMDGFIQDAVYKSYSKGLIDGFAQGVAAEAETTAHKQREDD